MKEIEKNQRNKAVIFAAAFLLINMLAIFAISKRETSAIQNILGEQANEVQEQFDRVMDNYTGSFQLFVHMMSQQIENTPAPADIGTYLKGINTSLLEIEGETFDGLYMYYKGEYLYSWDTPYEEYEESGYDATKRPWYINAIKGNGGIVFTPPYKSYANPYILTTISQLQPDGETVFAYDIKMEDIQTLASSLNHYENGQIMIFDKNKTIIGSTDSRYLGENFYSSLEDAKMDGTHYCSYLLEGDEFNFMIFVPRASMLKATLDIWLIPLLVLELLLIYILGSISRGLRNRELRKAYVELGQTQKRLEIALSTAQRAAAIDELTGLMNYRSFQKELTETLMSMKSEESGILIMIDGDHFKQVNDNYGHNMGDEVIKLSAQMLIGRIRTVDLASRLHGDEFALFISDTDDFSVAERIMNDINVSIAKESKKRNMPPITLSSGAVIARHGDSYTVLTKSADEALYRAKETHNGAFASY